MTQLRLAQAQVNVTVGDLSGNSRKIISFIREAKSEGVDIVVFPELAVTGYPPEDLLLKPQFIRDNLRFLKEIAKKTRNIIAIVGFVDGRNGAGKLFNSAAVLYQGNWLGTYHKIHLPNYGVFDEKRYFQPGEECPLLVWHGFKMGINVCEDIWEVKGPARTQARGGAEIVLNINASPYHAGKLKLREDMLSQRARENVVFVSYTNLVGGQDELVFDGGSMLLSPEGDVIARAKQFAEDLLIEKIDLSLCDKLRGARFKLTNIKSVKKIIIPKEITPVKKPLLPLREPVKPLDPLCEIYSALCFGLKDYVNKNGFKKVVIGLSGGVDSSITAAIAVDALGRDNVIGVFMPSLFSSRESEEDARELAGALRIKFRTLPITDIWKMYKRRLSRVFKGLKENIAEENLQARIRGNLLMALSNKFGYLVLTTGNKSEMSVGYATLYGDMAGGFAVIKDVPKELVYKLSRYRNSQAGRYIIPLRVLEKPPTAELRPNQKDTDSLPPYEALDPILKDYVEEEKSFTELVSSGYEEETVKKVISLVDRSEYKRRQAPPGIKITPKAFGRDRRMPITNKYKSG